MIKAEIDITEQMQGFSKFAKQDDVNHAMDEILLYLQKDNDDTTNCVISNC